MARYDLHPDALVELEDATRYYLEQASPIVAAAFVAAVEAAIEKVTASPAVWRIVAEPGVRCYLLSRFPYGLYYRWDQQGDRVSIYAVMHLHRKPGYWKSRIADLGGD